MRFRDHLPQLDGGRFLTDGGLETYILFQRGIDLPEFASFPLVEDESGRNELRAYYENYIRLAAEHDAGFILESPTWRANGKWGAKLGYDASGLDRVNRQAIQLMHELRDEHESELDGPMVVSGCVGPEDDGYTPAESMTAAEARDYHATQIKSFAEAGADMVTAITMNYTEEALGVAAAADAAEIPSAISFTVETDGRLPTGQPLAEAIQQVDAETDNAPAYFMINCAHPTHFEDIFDGGQWQERIRGLRANASTASHAELDEATELDSGDPEDLGRRYGALAEAVPGLVVFGGCCGTDHRHVGAVAANCLS